MGTSCPAVLAGEVPDPAEVGYDLAYGHRLTAGALGLCVPLLSDLAAEFTLRARRAVKARVTEEFSSGFAEGLQKRVRDDSPGQLRRLRLPDLAFYGEDADEIRRALATVPRRDHDLPEQPQATIEFRIRAGALQQPRWATATLGRDRAGEVVVVLDDVTFLRALDHGVDMEPTTGLPKRPLRTRPAAS